MKFVLLLGLDTVEFYPFSTETNQVPSQCWVLRRLSTKNLFHCRGAVVIIVSPLSVTTLGLGQVSLQV